MAIAAKRFEFIDKENVVGTSDFTKAGNTSTVTAFESTAPTTSEEDLQFINNTDPAKDEKKPDTVVDKAVRTVKGANAAILDVASLSTKDIGDRVKKLTGDNPIVNSILNQFPALCKDQALGKTNDLGLDGGTVDCNGRKRKSNDDCGPGGVEALGSAVDKLSPNGFNFSYLDIAGTYDMLLGLTALGYKQNLCGIFSALSPGIDNKLLSRAASTIVGTVAEEGDALGIFDMAGSSAGLDVKTHYPWLTDTIMLNFKKPTDLRERDYVQTNQQLEASLDLFDDIWRTSETDGVQRITGLRNNDFKDLQEASVMENVYGTNNLDTAPLGDDIFNLLSFTE